MIVTARHLFTIPGYSTRRGFCRGKSREWFRRHGLDWRAFARDGIDAEILAATGDGLALALIEWAQQCEPVNKVG
jgi:hypothetical protein